MNILYLITGLGVGGAEIITIDTANMMVKRGHRVVLVYMTGGNDLQSRIDNDIQVETLQLSKNPLSFIFGLFKFKKIVNTFAPDVVHANMVHANIFNRLSRLFISFPKLICTAHNKNEGGALRLWWYRITNKLSDLNTNVSEEAVAYYIQKKAFSRGNSICVYNGISLSRFKKDAILKEASRKKYGFNNNDFVFISVGRLTEAKDFSNLLQAFNIVYNTKQNVRLIILGEGNLRENLERQIISLNLQDKVSLLGIKSDVESYYNMSDCFVLSSAWEGFGIVLAEAMACELPVITTNAGGCAEVVNQPKWVVPIRDSDALSKIMLHVVGMSQSERELQGKINRNLTLRFNIEDIVNQWEAIYKKI